MVEIYVELPYERYRRLEEIRERSKYPTVQDIVKLAIDNLITREAGRRISAETQEPPVVSKRVKLSMSEVAEEGLAEADFEQIVREGDETGYARNIGLWVMTNSLLPMKVILRSLAEAGGGPVDYDKFAMRTFGLARDIRAALPKEFKAGLPARESESSKGRFRAHFLDEAGALGLLKISYEEGKDSEVQLTGRGYEFSRLPNPCLDNDYPTATLSDEEITWMLSHLKVIDKKGVGEYRWMQRVAQLIMEGDNTTRKLVEGVSNDDMFDEFVKGWSRKFRKGDLEGFQRQKTSLAQASYGSTFRIMSDLGLVRRIKRGLFEVTQDGQRYFQLQIQK